MILLYECFIKITYQYVKGGFDDRSGERDGWVLYEYPLGKIPKGQSKSHGRKGGRERTTIRG